MPTYYEATGDHARLEQHTKGERVRYAQQLLPAYTSGGDYEITDGNNPSYPTYTIVVGEDMQPGSTALMSANLVASTPDDGICQASVKVGNPANAHYEFVNYKVVDGVPVAN